jgi:hypothetical protein
MEKLPPEVKYVIAWNSDVSTLKSLYGTSVGLRLIAIRVSRRLLAKYEVDYKDPTNFIYIQNNVRQNWFRSDHYDSSCDDYNFPALLELYGKFFWADKIDCCHRSHAGYETGVRKETDLFFEAERLPLNLCSLLNSNYFPKIPSLKRDGSGWTTPR